MYCILFRYNFTLNINSKIFTNKFWCTSNTPKQDTDQVKFCLQYLLILHKTDYLLYFLEWGGLGGLPGPLKDQPNDFMFFGSRLPYNKERHPGPAQPPQVIFILTY